ncbi:hypothetical protein Tco_0124978, partial [Tanacetum coccineum]
MKIKCMDKGSKERSPPHNLRQKPGRYICCQNHKLIADKGTINMGLWYPKDSGFELTAFSDADHAGFLDTRKSTSGGIQFLGDKLVENSIIELYFVRTEYQLADMFTKALPEMIGLSILSEGL